MKKISLILLILFIVSSIYANEFVISSYKPLSSDQSARVYEKLDDNGDACAIIKVKTDIKEALQFDSGLKLPHPAEKKYAGEYWVYVSPGEQSLRIMAEGFTPKRISLTSYKIKSHQTYEIVVKAKEENKVTVAILSDPPNAEKWIDGKFLGKGDNYKILVGKHELKVSKEGYKSYIKEIEVNIDNVLFKNIELEEIEELQVQVTTTPQKADVYINEEFKGITDYPTFLMPGKYEVYLSKPGYISIKEEIEVKENEFNTFHFDLEKNVGYLFLKVKPADARIFIDNQESDLSASYELSPGLHKISVSREGFTTISEDIEITKGGQFSKEIMLDQITGSLQLTVQPLDANVSLKTKEDIVYQRWQGMNQLKDIPVGNYELEFSCEGYESQKKSINIRKDNKSIVHVSLIELNTNSEDHTGEMPDISPTVKYDSMKKYLKNKSEKKSIKFRFGAEFGPFTLGAKVGYMINEKMSANIYLLLRPVGACIMPTFQYYIPFSHRIGMEVGVGAYVGYAIMPVPGITIDNDFATGISVLLGIKYSIEDLPLGIALQYQPSYALIGDWAGSLADINIMLELEL